MEGEELKRTLRKEKRVRERKGEYKIVGVVKRFFFYS